tara:strand:- start:94 stop:576 length:483 start_codon:yes stop_codon:yes gene_type:complete
MPVHYIKAITERYEQLGYAPYRWYYADTSPPFEPMSKPLSDCKVGVLSTSGAYVAGQVAYHYKDDTSTRAIPKDTPAEALRFSHITENYLESPRKDPHTILPLAALRRLESEGVIGELADEVYSCMGGIYSQRRVREELIPELEQRFRAQEIDVAYLVPM